MKLLFDENISYRLAQLLADVFPDSVHVRDVGLKAAADSLIWDFASKDSDLHQRSFVLGQPPKVIWVRLGNCSTAEIENLLRRSVAVIISFGEDVDASFLSLS